MGHLQDRWFLEKWLFTWELQKSHTSCPKTTILWYVGRTHHLMICATCFDICRMGAFKKKMFSENPSKKVADVFFVQWPELQKFFFVHSSYYVLSVRWMELLRLVCWNYSVSCTRKTKWECVEVEYCSIWLNADFFLSMNFQKIIDL